MAEPNFECKFEYSFINYEKMDSLFGLLFVSNLDQFDQNVKFAKLIIGTIRDLAKGLENLFLSFEGERC